MLMAAPLMCPRYLETKARIFVFILGCVFLKNEFSSAKKSEAQVLSVTQDYMEVTLTEKFYLKCAGLDSLVWEVETIFLNDIVRFDFSKEILSREAGRLFFDVVVVAMKADYLYPKRCSCDFIRTGLDESTSLCIFVRGMREREPFNYTNMCSLEVEVDPEEKLELECHVNGVAQPKVRWYHKKKPLPASENSHKLVIDKMNNQYSGLYECKAEREAVADLPNATQTVIRASYVSQNTIMDINSAQRADISCFADGVTLPKFSFFYKEGTIFDTVFEEMFSGTKSNYVQILFDNFITKALNGSSSIFECRIEKEFGIATIMGNTTWRKTQGVYINKTNMRSPTMEAYENKPLELFCRASGIPEPNVTWYLNGKPFPYNITGVKFSDDSMTLKIAKLVKENSGLYECKAQNSYGGLSLSTKLIVKDEVSEENIDGKQLAVLACAGLLVLLTSVLLVLLRRRFYRRQKLQDGTIIQNISLLQQAQMLPYDKKYEFPKSRLKLGRTLGKGAFGIVVKAKATGLKKGEPWTTVAVKMIKEKSDKNQQKALMSELKILIHLGHHINVVNLLGAVTKYIQRGELMVMLEYCRFGNLRNYLLKHRHKFVPHESVSSEKNKFGKKRSYANSRSRIYGSYDDEYHSPSDSSESEDLLDADSSGRKPSNELCRHLVGIVPEPTDLSSGSSDSDSEIFLRLGRKKHGITTADLICYAFQCARGMNFIAFKKLIHRDLAARNILLAEDNVVKICDFGLTKDLYYYPDFAKPGNVPLPVKWMAIESIGEKIFSTKSDVWSFGVLLWELFTLGSDPYPGVEVDEKFFKKLKEGYRMEKPELAPDNIYQMMRDCWKLNPMDRPNFARLSDTLGSLLEAEVAERYLKLNEPYEKMNRTILDPTETTASRSEENTSAKDTANVQTSVSFGGNAPNDTDDNDDVRSAVSTETVFGNLNGKHANPGGFH